MILKYEAMCLSYNMCSRCKQSKEGGCLTHACRKGRKEKGGGRKKSQLISGCSAKLSKNSREELG